MIPSFPEFKPLELDDQREIMAWTMDFDPYSDFEFGSLWSWNVSNKMMVTKLLGNLVLKFPDYATEEHFFTLIGRNQLNETASLLLQNAAENSLKSYLKLVPEDVALHLDQSIFKVEEDADNRDYILSASMIASYATPEFGNIRRNASFFFRKTPNHKVIDLDLHSRDTVASLSEFFKRFESLKRAQGADPNEHEYFGMMRCINAAQVLNVCGYGLYVDDALVAFSLHGLLANAYSICHFEKADTLSFKGITEFFRREIARRLGDRGVLWINFEQDLGIAGLRFSKSSYRPQKFLRKYAVRLI